VRDTEEIFKSIENIKEVSENINFYIPIYSDAGVGIRDIEFFKKKNMKCLLNVRIGKL
jgi:hypothetical protein